MNDVGQIVGGYSVSDGGLFGPGTVGFLAPRTPEPASLALLATGMGLLGVAARRRHRAGA